MRVWLIALLVALLPLRGWLGDTMAIAMASGHAPCAAAPCAEALGAAHTEHTHADHADHADHGDHARAAADATPSSNGDTDHPPVTHAACDVCNGPALATAPLPAAGDRAPFARQATPPVRFASATPRNDHKPPIA